MECYRLPHMAVQILIKGIRIFFLALLLTSLAQTAKGRTLQEIPDIPEGKYLVLCYHSVQPNPPAWSKYTISRTEFAQQMDYLKQHGFTVVSFQQILDAHSGKAQLPPRPVLLTFDDAYLSFYDYVLPILERYGYPAVLAVVGTWIDKPPKKLPERLMTWKQLKEVASHPLVEIASHSYNLHRAIRYNPAGNVAAAVSVRHYLAEEKRYETLEEYKERLRKDFAAQKDLLKEKLGVTPRIMVWPYGRFNAISQEIAVQSGIIADFSLEVGFNTLDNLHGLRRLLIEQYDEASEFKKAIKYLSWPEEGIRAVQVDLDLIYDPKSYEQTDANLGKLIDRLFEMKVNTVFLQAFSDMEGSGNIKSVYFHNRVLPVRADIFSHAVHQLSIRNMAVYAWMPTIGIVLPDEEMNRRLAVKEIKEDGSIKPSSSWYRRLSPFSDETRRLLTMLYEDLAANNQISGILFQDDAYLNDTEDLNSAALPVIEKIFGTTDITRQMLEEDSAKSRLWCQAKTDQLTSLIAELKKVVKRYRPYAKFARNIYARVLMEPRSKLWFAQDFDQYLSEYDFAVVMAYPVMEEAKDHDEWLDRLVTTVAQRPEGLEKTIFKLQSYDWKHDRWMPTSWLYSSIRRILSRGGRHIAYYPDNFWENRPKIDLIKLEMSTQDFPFKKPR